MTLLAASQYPHSLVSRVRTVVRTRTVCAAAELERADLQSGECFVLLKLLDNTERNPSEVKQVNIIKANI